jgi:ferredoxin
MVTSFKIQLQTPKGIQSFECPDDQYILDAAEEAGIDMTYSCRAGACSSCVAKRISGSLDQSDQSFLDDEQMESGYCLLCIAYATSELVLKTNCEEELW